MQTAIVEHESITVQEATRNAIAALGNEATKRNILTRLLRQFGNLTTNELLSALWDMHCRAEITPTPGGAYVIGHHATSAAQDLTLTSEDPNFGQPSLF